MTDESFSHFLLSFVPTVLTQKTLLTLQTKWEESLLQNNLLTYGKRWKQMLLRSRRNI